MEDAPEHQDPHVRLRASAQLLDRVLPKPQPGASINVVVGEPATVQVPPSEVIRARLAALQASQLHQPDGDLQALPWEGGAVVGELEDDGDGWT